MGYSLIGTFQQISLRSPPTGTPTMPPMWVTPSGNLGGELTLGNTFNYQLEVTDPQSETITYTRLPYGLSLMANKWFNFWSCI